MKKTILNLLLASFFATVPTFATVGFISSLRYQECIHTLMVVEETLRGKDLEHWVASDRCIHASKNDPSWEIWIPTYLAWIAIVSVVFKKIGIDD